jgi:hypothetical protein
VEDVQQGAAVIAAPLLSAERFGAAGDDVGDNESEFACPLRARRLG